jgi:predicted nucleotidyltransferase
MTGLTPVLVEHHRGRAIMAAQAATRALAELGVATLITGSLARDSFGLNSDIDFLVTSCPRSLKYAIEGVVEDTLGGLPFDVVYIDELSEWQAFRFKDGAVDASHLR